MLMPHSQQTTYPQGLGLSQPLTFQDVRRGENVWPHFPAICPEYREYTVGATQGHEDMDQPVPALTACPPNLSGVG